jgi:hypothetical protein
MVFHQNLQNTFITHHECVLSRLDPAIFKGDQGRASEVEDLTLHICRLSRASLWAGSTVDAEAILSLEKESLD